MIKYETIIGAAFVAILFGIAFPVSAVGGLSLVLLRDLTMLSTVGLLLVARGSMTYQKNISITVLAILGILISTFIASFEAAYPALVTPLYTRLLLLAAVIFLLHSITVTPDFHERVYKICYRALSVYLVVSILLYAIPAGRTEAGAMQGYAGQHFSKFIMVITVLFFIVTVIHVKRSRVSERWADYLMLGISILGLVLILQRGAIIAVCLGFVVCNRLIFKKGNLLYRIFFWSFFVIAIAAIMSNERFISYAFFEGIGPEQIFSALLDGTFSMDMIRARGRFELADAITHSLDVGFFGNGPGAAKYVIGLEFFDGREPHNDILMISADLGMIGLIPVLLLLLSPIVTALKSLKSASQYAKAMIVTGTASIVGFVAWMPLSNVLVYMQYNMVFATLLLLSGAAKVDAQHQNFPVTPPRGPA